MVRLADLGIDQGFAWDQLLRSLDFFVLAGIRFVEFPGQRAIVSCSLALQISPILSEAHKAIREASYKSTYSTWIGFAFRNRLFWLLLDTIHAFQDFINRRRIAPVRE